MARTSKYAVNMNEVVPSIAKWRAGLYFRLSKEDGDKDEDNKPESDSISSQRLIVEDYLMENPDISFFSEYADDGFTGLNFDRPEFQRMIEDIRLGRINCIIVKDLSRFGRNYLESGQYLDIFFPVMNVRFISVNDNIDSYLYPSSMDNISVSFKNVMNEEYCRDISKKIRSTFVAKRENGEYICGFPIYGYVKDPNHKGQLLLDPEAAEVVHNIFIWFSQGNSFRSIAFKLNELGVLTPMMYKNQKYPSHNRKCKTALWCVQTIKSILTNPTYTGDLLQGKYEKINHKVDKVVKTPPDKWVLVENHHEPIIDKMTFEAIQTVINRDTRISHKTRELGLFSGFVVCADCGHNLVKRKPGHANLRDKYHYYTCGTYDTKSKSACTRHTTRSDILEQTVFAVISKHIDIAVDIEALINSINSSPLKKSATSQAESLLIKQEKEKNKLENILLDLYPDYKSGLISKEQYLALKEKYETDIAKLKHTIANLQASLEKDRQGIDSSNSYIQQFKKFQNFTKLTREVLINLVDVILVYENGEIEIKMKHQDEFMRVVEYIDANRELLKTYKNIKEKTPGRVKLGEAV